MGKPSNKPLSAAERLMASASSLQLSHHRAMQLLRQGKVTTTKATIGDGSYDRHGLKLDVAIGRLSTMVRSVRRDAA
jgi:hypothetical protein